VHENVGVGEIEDRRAEVEKVFSGYVGEQGGAKDSGRRVAVEHVERVKMYAPGVVHCVFDVRVSGREELRAGPIYVEP
jgi:tRNA wybutosine-synthesizing protein 2